MHIQTSLLFEIIYRIVPSASSWLVTFLVILVRLESECIICSSSLVVGCFSLSLSLTRLMILDIFF